MKLRFITGPYWAQLATNTVRRATIIGEIRRGLEADVKHVHVKRASESSDPHV